MEENKNHPEEASKEDNLKHKSNKGSVIALVVVIILAIAAVVGTWYYMNNKAKNDKKTRDAQIQQLQNQLNELKKQSAKQDETADWLTYNDVYDGLSFKYPKDWKMTTIDKTAEIKRDVPEWKGPFINTYITSPSGFKITLKSHISGIGGGCNPPECPQNQFISKEKVLTLSNGVELHLVKYQQFDASGKNLQYRQIGFIGINPKLANQQSLENYQGYPPYFLFTSPGVDEAFTDFSGPGSDTTTNYQTKLTAEQYFAQPDLQTAEKIFKSIKQI